MKTNCKNCNKKIDVLMIDIENGAYFNSKKEIVCYKCMLLDEQKIH